MKKIVLLLALCTMFTLPSFSQDCPMCGDWQGQYWGEYGGYYGGKWQTLSGNIKIVVRIKRNGDSFTVRKKTIYPNGRIEYDDNHQVEYDPNEPNTITWYNLYDTETDVGIDAKKFGSYYNRINYFLVSKVTLDGNQMNHQWWHKLVYVSDKTIINEYGREEVIPFNMGAEEVLRSNLVLYKDDGDW